MFSSQSNHDVSLHRTIRFMMDYLEKESQAHHITQRTDKRHNVHSPAKLGLAERSSDDMPANFKPLYHAWVTDMSNSGIGMLLEHDLPSNVIMWADLSSMIPDELQDQMQKVLPIRIAYCMKLLPNTYRIGGTFVKDIRAIPEKAWTRATT